MSEHTKNPVDQYAEIRKRIERVRSLDEKASKGPWVRWKGSGGTSIMQGPAQENTAAAFRGGADGEIANCESSDAPVERYRANARWIAATRTLAPRLATDLETLLERVLNLESLLEQKAKPSALHTTDPL